MEKAGFLEELEADPSRAQGGGVDSGEGAVPNTLL